MGHLKKLAGETAIYGVSSILGRMLNYLLVPIYTSYFAPAEYGIVTELYAYAAFLIIVYTYGMETAFFRFATHQAEQKKNIFNAAETSILLSSMLFSLILVLFASPIVNFLEYPGRERYVYWFAAILAIDALVAIPFARLRLEGKAIRFAVAKLINIGLNIFFNLLFIIGFLKIYQGEWLKGLQDEIQMFYRPDLGADYVFIANLIANAALLLILGDILLKIKLKLNWQTLKPMLIYAYPLLFMGLAGATNEMLSRALLKKLLPDNYYQDMSNLAALGVFGACYKLSVFMTLTIQAFRYAAEPFFFSRAKDKNSPLLFSDVMHWFIILGAFIFLTISLNLEIIAHLFLRSPQYWEGLPVVPILLLANLFLGIYFNLSVWFKLTDRTIYGTWIAATGAIITVGLNFLLIPLYGFEGSAVVTLITYLTMTIISYILGMRFYPIPYKIKKDLFIILGAVGVYYLVTSVEYPTYLLEKIVDIGVLAIFALIIYIMEKDRITKRISKNT
ncbi:MAG: lipopolysaccharide biosynthesis protein [Candidatus Cyclobacteriaceae bacterium M3_2C_046]